MLPAIALHDEQLNERFRSLIDEHGFVIVTEAYPPVELEALRRAILDLEAEASPENDAFVYQGEFLWAIWNLYELAPHLMRLVFAPPTFCLLAEYFQQPVDFDRATLMKKVPGNPRAIGWHQDLPVAVDQDLADESSAGVRDGVPHRYVSTDVVERKITARLHVEPQHEDGGCLQVIPGSHRWGQISPEEVKERAAASTPLLCPAPAGSILFYRPLLVHSSGPSTRTDTSQQRRVITNEFHVAGIQPDDSTRWYPWRQTVRIEKNGVYFKKPISG